MGRKSLTGKRVCCGLGIFFDTGTGLRSKERRRGV